MSGMLSRLFRAWDIGTTEFPGRGPGLLYFGPSGRRRLRTADTVPRHVELADTEDFLPPFLGCTQDRTVLPAALAAGGFCCRIRSE